MNISRTWTGSEKFLLASPFIGLLLGAFLVALPTILMITIPSKFDRAIVVRICRDGTKVFRMEDGEYRVRNYRATGPDIC
jgi:hypothetical protein